MRGRVCGACGAGGCLLLLQVHGVRLLRRRCGSANAVGTRGTENENERGKGRDRATTPPRATRTRTSILTLLRPPLTSAATRPRTSGATLPRMSAAIRSQIRMRGVKTPPPPRPSPPRTAGSTRTTRTRCSLPCTRGF
ncbi:hypothetical protein B0H19DRAFT_1116390 [Mycena capillaripes]|nr:hypothetical protein B0H19DRAFT_1116390 [Mycena capillaripes]